MKRIKSITIVLLLAVCLLCTGCLSNADRETTGNSSSELITLEQIPEYSGKPYIAINQNIPQFAKEDLTTDSFETYSQLDSLGRCSTAYANIGSDLMPKKKRGSIGQVKPSGWKTKRYDSVDGKYLYNRCHLIGYQLTAENANERNLITGTRSMNVDGMLPFENMVADYIKETDNHVLYRVTPIFEGNDLVAKGVQMEAQSVEDQGEGILFNVYVYNSQPGIEIDYSTGDSKLSNSQLDTEAYQSSGGGSSATYVLNTNTQKFHRPSCSSVTDIKDSNKKNFTGNKTKLTEQGYEPCKNCNP